MPGRGALIENLQTLREGFGPGAAERALLDIAALLATSCRRSDLVARLGEAQFALLAVDADPPTTSLLRQRLEKNLAAQNETRSPWGPIDLRVSDGVWSARDGRSSAAFLDSVEADACGLLRGIRNCRVWHRVERLLKGEWLKGWNQKCTL